jgi:photosystem II stability/assembly factor-like uncharacterized protein
MKIPFCIVRHAKLFLIITCILVAAFGTAFAQTLTQVQPPNTNWNFIVGSADGTILACTPQPINSYYSAPGLIYLSKNSGTSWMTCNMGNPVLSSWFWTGLCITADGNELIADSNNIAIYISTNSGASWNKTLTPTYANETLGPIASSADGTKLVVLGNFTGHSFVLTSTNLGQTWVSNPSPSSSGFNSMVCSADGRMIIASYEESFYFSTNFGVRWTNITSRLPGTEVLFVGCAAASGNIWVLIAQQGLVISTNSGITWALNYSNGNPIGPTYTACSADGTKFITSNDGGIYLSTNSGSTWQVFTNKMTLHYSVTASADGCQMAISSTNGIYLIQAIPSPKLNLTSSPSNLALAWTVPSKNFVLQQSADLASWMNVTNTPTLNFSSLQNQINFSYTNSSSFYRLANP